MLLVKIIGGIPVLGSEVTTRYDVIVSIDFFSGAKSASHRMSFSE